MFGIGGAARRGLVGAKRCGIGGAVMLEQEEL
jgi:hypothetical protein